MVSFLPLWIVALPLAFPLMVYFLKKRKEIIRDCLAVSFAAITFALSALLFLKVQAGPVSLTLPAFLGFGLKFFVDPLGAFFTLFSSFVWFLAVLFSLTYMGHEHARNRYYAFLFLTQAGCLGVFLTGDLFSLFVFFEIMSLASYVLVIHTETEEAMDAGRLYLFLGVAGGLSLLTGILLLKSFTGSVSLAPLLQEMTVPASARYGTAALLLLGFAIKAGMAPLHIWLPKAHPVAPSPASALLSGIMIKTGAYGIMRVVLQVFGPAEGAAAWPVAGTMGYAIIWLGVVTMFSAAFMALFQTNIKRILAYSSISQMGYILMGVGCAAYLGLEGPMGFSGSVFHIFNHAFFKAGMFMMVGAVYARTHELELGRLGGLFRDFPVTAVCFVVAACGIAGVPGLNGYASKTLLHHAIEDAAHHGSVSLLYAEKIFVLTSAFTVCYITKLTRGIFFGPRQGGLRHIAPEPLSEKLVFGCMALVIIFTGLLPGVFYRNVILPLTAGFPFDPYKVAYLQKLGFWGRQDLLAIAAALVLGYVFFLAFTKTGLFQKRLPAWLSIESLVYGPVLWASLGSFTRLGSLLETGVNRLYVRPGSYFQALFAGLAGWEERGEVALRGLLRTAAHLYTMSGHFLNLFSETLIVKSRGPLRSAAGCLDYFDNVIIPGGGHILAKINRCLQDWMYFRWAQMASYYDTKMHHLMRRTFIAFIKADYDTKGDPFYQMINPLNYNFDLIIVWLVLLVILVLGIY